MTKRIVGLLLLVLFGLAGLFGHYVDTPRKAHASTSPNPIATVYSGTTSGSTGSVLVAAVANERVYVLGANISASAADTIGLFDGTTLVMSFGVTTTAQDVPAAFWNRFNAGNGYSNTKGNALRIACSGGSILHCTFVTCQY